MWRTKSQLVTGVGFGAFVALLGLTQVDRPTAKGGGIVVTALMLVVGTCMAAVFARVALVASDEGVRIRNPLSTAVIAWGDVARFRIGRHGLLSAVCMVDLADGSSRDAFGIPVPRSTRGSKEQRMIDLLNEMVLTRRGIAPQGR